MNEIIARDIKELKFLTKEEREYLYSKSPNLNEYLIISFQESLRNCLLEYLNTPFLISFKKSKSADRLETTFLELKLDVKSLDFNLKVKDLPSIITHGYSLLDLLLKKRNNKTKEDKIIQFTPLKKGYYFQFPVLEEYVEFTQRTLSKYLKISVIHGSCSDLELTPFSDLDTFLLINKATVNSKKLLVEFKSHWIDSLTYLYKFDSLQHHNHMVATEFDLDFFPYHWLPPQVFEESTLIYGNDTLKFKLNKSDFFSSKIYFLLAQRFRDPNIKSKKYNEYSLKNDISILALLPVLYLQNIGFNVTKKESFSHPEFLSIDHHFFYKKISKVRNQWNVTNMSDFIISRFYNFYVRKAYLKYFISPIGTNEITRNSIIRDKFLSDLTALINTMSSNIIKRS